LFVQKKETKEKHAPLPRHPSVLAPHLGGCGTRAFSTQTVLAATHLLAQAEGAAKGI
jgi:phosphoglycerate dehydrogenase-like enzyme